MRPIGVCRRGHSCAICGDGLCAAGDAVCNLFQAGETLVQVANLTKLQIRAYFDEPEIGQLKVGQPVTIAWQAKPNQLWHGHVVEVPTTIITYGGTRNVGETPDQRG